MLRVFSAAFLGLLIAFPAMGYPLDRLGHEVLGLRRGAIVALSPEGKILGIINPRVAAKAGTPGSMAKLLTAATALERGRGDCVFTCRGEDCWKAHGRVELLGAISDSCSSYFYQLAEVMGNQAIATQARRAGFGAKTGLLQEEEPGVLDPSRRLGCGEEGFLATPLQWASFAAHLSTGKGLDWKPETYRSIQDGMRIAVDLGNAHYAAIPGIAVAGKTGTSVVSNRRYGWFVGYAPVKKPQIALCIFLEDASGFKEAAHLAHQVIRAYLEQGT